MRLLRQIRRSRGLTQRDLGRLLGRSRELISAIENGRRRATRARLLELGSVLGEPPESLLEEKRDDS
ncbi:MAG: helix-turn-helix transcriptional regulator [bacterium]